MAPPSGRNGLLRVVHLPWDGVNPYQQLLSRALKANGVESIEGSAHRLFFPSHIARARPDVLHIHWPDALILNDSLALSLLKSASFLAQILLTRLCGVRVVWTAHDLRSHERRHPHVEELVMDIFVRSCSAVIAHGPAAAAEVLAEHPGLPGGRVAVIPHGPFDAAPGSLSVGDAREALSVPEGAFVFLCFGQLRRYKGTDLLVDAFKMLRGHRRAFLLIAGAPRDGVFAAEVAKACEGVPSIRLDARVIDPATLDRLFVAADMVVLPYRGGLTSGVAALAKGYGRPCLATRSAAAMDAFGQDRAVFFDDSSVDGLRRGLQRMLDAPPSPAREFDSRGISWDEVAKKTLEVYSRAIS